MKKIVLSLLGILMSVSAMAQTGDTITISKYRMVRPTPYSMPFMSDSTDIKGKKFDTKSFFGGNTLIDLDDTSLIPVKLNADGYYDIKEEKGHLYNLITSLRTTKYEKVTVLVECNVPYRLYLDGKEVGQKNDSREEQKNPDSYSIKLEPSIHHPLLLRYMTAMDEKVDPKVRIRLVPMQGGNTTLSVRDDAKEYMSVDFTLSGESYNSVSVSPSGKYTIVRKRNYVNLKSIYTTLLYEGTKIKTELSGNLAGASWMPMSDRLWLTRDTDSGRQLLTYDPATMKETVLANAIPDGYFTILPNEETLIYYKSQEGPKTQKNMDRVLGRYDHNTANPDRDRSFLHIYDLKSGIYRPLTFGHRSTGLVASSLDGKEIIISSSYPTTTSPFSAGDYMTMNLATGKVDTLFTNEPNIGDIQYTSDRRYFLITGNADAFDGIGRNLPEGMIVNTYDSQLFLYDREKKTAKPLTKNFDPTIKRVLVSDKEMKALFSAEDRDYVHLFQMDLMSGQIKPLPNREDYIGSFSADNSLRFYAYEGESVNNSDRLYMGNLGSKSETLIDDLAAQRMKNLEVGKVSDWTFTMPNGEKVPGRYYLPADFSASKKYPMLVYYYGGTSPSSRLFSWTYSAPMLAGQGYVVLVLNPSGTTGWGQEYASRHVNAWGKRTADEIISSVKGFCSEHSFVDTKNVGCFGASYGGFMTQFILTETDFFGAAMSHAGISAISSYWGQGTWGIGYSTVASAHSYPWNNPQLYAEQSPLFRADRITTPLLLTHGTADTNVPFGESVQMYNAMKILGKEVELIRVYGEDHGIAEPHKKIEWLHTMMAWFQKHLKDDSTWWDEMYPDVNL